jgi:rod shape determining protein RodA
VVFRRPGRFADLDLWLLFAVLLLGIIGVITIHSATREATDFGLSYFATRQLFYLLISLATALGIAFVDPNWLMRHAWKIGAVLALALMVVFAVGHWGHGARRWINLGFVTFQPSEFARPIMVLLLAVVWGTSPKTGLGIKELLIGALIVGVTAGLIALEPDLGTAFSLYPIFLGMLFWGGASLGIVVAALAPIPAMILSQWWWALLIFVIGIVVSLRFSRIKWFWTTFFSLLILTLGAATPIIWGMLKTYQQQRILMFLNPGLDPQGSGYSLIQSMIAIGSGGFWGKGYLAGTQSHLRFLPESHTDFVFAVLGEEWGFVGCAVVVLLFLFIIIRGWMIATRAQNSSLSLLAGGATLALMFKMLINMGMVVGLLPVTGVPLPFITSGGSSLLADMMLVGLILNVRLRRYMF